MKILSAVFFVSFFLFQIKAEAQQAIPDGVIHLEPGKEVKLNEGRIYQLDKILVVPPGQEGTSPDGANRFKFCGEVMDAPFDARVIRIDNTVVHFDQQAAATTTVMTNHLPIWLEAGSTICLPQNHRSNRAIILYWNQP